jgi:Leucine-rich repeat (LRR) protein
VCVFLRPHLVCVASNNLEGQLPEEIGHLTKLDFLNLKQNALTGSIPIYLKQFPLLDYLDLSHNQISGSIPNFLGDLDRLEVLGLGHNQLTGKVPGSLGPLRLKTFSIEDNILTGELSPVALMTNLRYLYAENNSFEGKLDNGLLADLAHLVELDLSGNTFEADSIPRYLFTHPHLRVLDLHDNQLAGTIPETIPGNSVLRYLSLRENDITSSIPSQIHHLAALTHLDLEANALTGTLPAEELGKMTTLSYLFLGKNPIENTTLPDELSSLKSLQELSLDGLQLTGPIPAWIENFSELKLLDLRTNSLTGTVPINFSNLQELNYLMLSGNLLTGPVPEGLGSRSNLVVVSLHQNGFIGEAGDLCSADSAVELLTTDCGAIACPCCNDCCDSEECYGDILWDALENSQGDWEENFERSDYGFNPHILFASEEPKGRN